MKSKLKGALKHMGFLMILMYMGLFLVYVVLALLMIMNDRQDELIQLVTVMLFIAKWVVPILSAISFGIIYWIYSIKKSFN